MKNKIAILGVLVLVAVFVSTSVALAASLTDWGSYSSSSTSKNSTTTTQGSYGGGMGQGTGPNTGGSIQNKNPGLPRTGAGGNAAMNYIILGISALGIIGGAVLMSGKLSGKKV